jgi:hypothetical protein
MSSDDGESTRNQGQGILKSTEVDDAILFSKFGEGCPNLSTLFLRWCRYTASSKRIGTRKSHGCGANFTHGNDV